MFFVLTKMRNMTKDSNFQMFFFNFCSFRVFYNDRHVFKPIRNSFPCFDQFKATVRLNDFSWNLCELVIKKSYSFLVQFLFKSFSSNIFFSRQWFM